MAQQQQTAVDEASAAKTINVVASEAFGNDPQEFIDHFINRHMIYPGGGSHKRTNMCTILSLFLSVDTELSIDSIQVFMAGKYLEPNFWRDYDRNIIDLELHGYLKAYMPVGLGRCNSVNPKYMIATHKAFECAKKFKSSSNLTLYLFDTHPNF
jgi:hypothetical protein